jgi:type I restriction enzyme S subunit
MVNGWETTTIGELLEFKNGLNKGKEFFGQGTPIVNYMDVYKNRGIYAEQLHGRVTLSTEEIKRFDVHKGDVFFTRTSETPEEVGYASVMLDDIDDCVFSGFVLRGRPITDRLDIGYCQYAFMTEYIRKAVMSGCTYTTRALTNGKQLSAIEIPLPPLLEQRRIAEALSDTDALISALEKLIAKKCAIKQGAMQELLTGKRRLEGYSGKWVERKLGDLCGKITTGKFDANAMKPNGKYRFYTCAKNYYFIDNYAFDTEALLISGNGENVGYVHYYKGKFNAYQRTYILYEFSQNIMFVKYYLDYFLSARIDEEVNAGNTPYIKLGTLTQMLLFLPTIAEQTAIASIISDMDAELDVLTTKLNELRNIKQGMMSELLTGRIRLTEQKRDGKPE